MSLCRYAASVNQAYCAFQNYLQTGWIWKYRFSAFAWRKLFLTAPFNNMRTLKFKDQPTKWFFATVNQMYGDSSQLPTTVERMVIKSLSTVHTTKHSSAVVGSCMGGAAEHLIDGCEKRILGWALNFRVRMLLKGAVNRNPKWPVIVVFLNSCGVMWPWRNGFYLLKQS